MAIVEWLLIFLGVLMAIFIAITVAGFCFPKSHSVGRSLLLEQPVDAVWEAISDFAKQTEWNDMIVSVERMEDKNGHEIWRETYSGNYPLLLETIESDPPKKLVRAIADEKGPFAGQWTYTIEPEDTGSRLTITEDGEIANPFFRFMARMFMNPAKYIELYMKQVAKKFGEPATIESVKR